MLARAYRGIVQFMEEFGWMAVRVTVLDDEVGGQVGTGTLLNFQPRKSGSNGSSLVKTS